MIRTKDEILRILRENKEAVQQFGVRRLGLFGSASKGEAKENSDLDFLVEFDRKSFDSYFDLKMFLEELFKSRVDLVIKETIKPRLREAILNEVIYAPGL